MQCGVAEILKRNKERGRSQQGTGDGKGTFDLYRCDLEGGDEHVGPLSGAYTAAWSG